MEQVESLLTRITQEMGRAVRLKLDPLAQQLLSKALYYREVLVRNNLGHNYTGNLVNSICVGVYYHGTYQRGYFGSKELGKRPIMGQMTNLKSGSARRYVFGEAMQKNLRSQTGNKNLTVDYMGMKSSYKATEKTDARTYTEAMAEEFLRGIKPVDSNGYSLILAYPVIYARYIENERNSTGMALVEDDFTSRASQIARWFVEDIAVDGGNSNLMLDSWVENLYNQWGGEEREESEGVEFDRAGASLYYRDMSYAPPKMNITPADEKKPNEPVDDPLGGDFYDDAPF